MEITVSCSTIFLNQTWNLLLPPSRCKLEEFQFFKVLRPTIDNHSNSGLHLLIKSNDVCVYCMKRGEEAQIKQPNDIKFPSWLLASCKAAAETSWLSVDDVTASP